MSAITRREVIAVICGADPVSIMDALDSVPNDAWLTLLDLDEEQDFSGTVHRTVTLTFERLVLP